MLDDDLKRDVHQDFAIKHTLCVLHTIDAKYYNWPPSLITLTADGIFNNMIAVQLEYEDMEGDLVKFSLVGSPQHGKKWFKP